MKIFFARLYHFLGLKCDRPWYPFLIGFLAFIDNFTLIVPTDGMLVSSVLLRPLRWKRFAVAVATGSSLGAILMAAVAQHQGLELIQAHYPQWLTTDIWKWSAHFLTEYGLIVVFLVGLTPFTQQPTVILAALSGSPLLAISAALFLGRLIKYIFMGYVASHAPHLLRRLWGLQSEIKPIENS